MSEYPVEYNEKNTINSDLTPSRPYCYGFSVKANTIEKAAVKAAKELEKIGFIIRYKEVWNAKIKQPEGSKGEDYEILREGIWLIDPKTGKRRSDLEEKLNQKQ